MKITKGEKQYRPFGLSGNAFFTPYYVNDKFVINLVSSASGNFSESDQYYRNEVAQKLWDLHKNKGRFIQMYTCRFDNPCSLLDFVIEREYSFVEPHNLFHTSEYGFTDFGGNLNEQSCAFMFRIYDDDLVQQLKWLLYCVEVFI